MTAVAGCQWKQSPIMLAAHNNKHNICKIMTEKITEKIHKCTQHNIHSKKEKKIEDRNHRAKYNGLPYYIGRP